MTEFLASAIGGAAVGQALQPFFDRLKNFHQYTIVFLVIVLLFLWFVILPGPVKKKL